MSEQSSDVLFHCANCNWVDEWVRVDDTGPKCPECGCREIDKEEPEYGYGY